MSKKFFLVALLSMAMLPVSAPFAAAQAVPSGTNMLIRLETPLSTRDNRPGDRFTATVLEPNTYRGAIINGHVQDVDESDRLSGRTELSLAFDSIEFRNGSRPLRAQVTRVIESEDVKIVDSEGRLRSGSRTTDTLTRSGIGGAVGGVLGGVLGGGTGALLGVLLGAGAGAGSLYAEGAREIQLDPGTMMEISTGYTSRPRTLARSEYDQGRGLENDRGLVMDVQNALSDQGYDPGSFDGIMGWRTREALRDFQRDNGLAVTGRIDRATADALGIR